MTQTKPTAPTAEEVINDAKAKAAVKAPQARPTAPRDTSTAPRKSAEVVEPTDEQEQTIESQLLESQKATQEGILAVARANSKAISTQVLDLTQNLASFEIIKGMAKRLEGGEHGVTEVTTAFLYGTARSGYQVKDAIANLEVAPPLLYQAIGTITEAQPLLNEATETKQLTAA